MITELPPLQTGKLVWYGPIINQRQNEWIIRLTTKEIRELEQASASFLKSGIPIGEMKKSSLWFKRLLIAVLPFL